MRPYATPFNWLIGFIPLALAMSLGLACDGNGNGGSPSDAGDASDAPSDGFPDRAPDFRMDEPADTRNPVDSGFGNGNCYCYFIRDCPPAHTCERNSPRCFRMQPKPGQPNACTIPGDNSQQHFDCDGYCQSTTNSCFAQPPEQVALAFDLWRQAYRASLAGDGGVPDAALVTSARAVPFQDATCADSVARTALSFVNLCVGEDALTHPEDPHVEEEHTLADLSEDACRLAAFDGCFGGFLAELEAAGAGESLIAAIAEACPSALPFASPCTGTGALDCVSDYVLGLVPLFVDR